MYKQAEEDDTVLYVETTVLLQESGAQDKLGKVGNLENIILGLCKNAKKMKGVERKRIMDKEKIEDN